jgi:outer membrane immunogenic protein
MRSLSTAAIAALSTIILTQVVSAADLPRKAPAPMFLPTPVINWTGFYAGLNGGGTWGNNNSVNTVSDPVQGFFDGVASGSYAANSALGATGNISVGDNAAFIGGGQIGYNWQFAPAWVAGIEADIQGVSHNNGGSILNTSVGPFPWAGAAEVLTTQITSSKRLDYLGTVRGRVGFLLNQTLLVYGTGGLAYAGVKASTSISQSNNDCQQFPGACIVTSVATTGSFSDTRSGWTIGGGVEWMFAPQWSAKGEYLYYDLGSVTFNNGTLLFGNGTFGGAGGPAQIASQSTTKFSGSVVRAGVNYHF